jgi:preprotein translocase subunit SecY
MDAQTLLMQTISGDRYRVSVFALGVSPYMISGIIVQVLMSMRSSNVRAKMSPKKINRVTLAIMLLLAVIQAVLHLDDLQFTATGVRLLLTEMTAVAEMVAGTFIILWLSERNKRYGIGGQTALILVNILDGLMTTLQGHSMEQLAVPLLVSFAVLVLIIIMENGEKRISVQRISIHNIYADKNYLAIKLNPIGVMPVMFSSAFFMLPQILFVGMEWLLPNSERVHWCKEQMTLNHPLGIVTYLVILYLLTVGFSQVFLSPGDLTDQFLKSGDSILNVRSGRDTRRYLTKEIVSMSFFSATMMGLCLGVPLVLQLQGNIDSSLAMLPSSVMMLTGVWCNLYQEIVAVCNYDAYQPFI